VWRNSNTTKYSDGEDKLIRYDRKNKITQQDVVNAVERLVFLM